MTESERLMRKGDQESELGSLAASEGDKKAAAAHFAKAKEYWRQAAELRETQLIRCKVGKI